MNKPIPCGERAPDKFDEGKGEVLTKPEIRLYFTVLNILSYGFISLFAKTL